VRAAEVLYRSSVSTHAKPTDPVATSSDQAHEKVPNHITLFAPIRYCLPLSSVYVCKKLPEPWIVYNGLVTPIPIVFHEPSIVINASPESVPSGVTSIFCITWSALSILVDMLNAKRDPPASPIAASNPR